MSEAELPCQEIADRQVNPVRVVGIDGARWTWNSPPINERKPLRDPQQLLLALRHPLRRQILKLMVERGGPLSPSQASVMLKKPLTSVSYHVRSLVNCGVLDLHSTRPVRGSIQHYYLVHPAVEATQWVREAIGMGSG